MNNKVLTASTLAFAAMCLSAGVVLAQNPDQGAQPAQGTDAGASTAQSAQGNGSAAGLQEVVVTAERRSLDIQTTPIAIQAISGDQLRSQQVIALNDLQLVAPSFQDFSPAGYLEQYNIRGVGTDNTLHSAQGVAVLRDGALLSSSVSQEGALFDIADVEVLEGPQGTLIGSNGFAGAIEINSANPNFNGLNGYIEGQVGDYSDRMVQGAVNLPISDTFAMRLAFYDMQEGSFWKDIGATAKGYYVNASGAIEPMNSTPNSDENDPGIDPGSTDQDAARLSFLWQPTDNFQAVAKLQAYDNIIGGGLSLQPSPYTYTTLFGAGTGPTYAGCTTQSAALNYAGATGNQLICSGKGTPGVHSTFYYPGETPYVLDYYGQEMYYHEQESQYVLQLSYTLPGGTVLRSESALIYANINQQNNGSYGPENDGVSQTVAGPDYDATQDITLISPTTGKLNWIVGASWYYRTDHSSQFADSVTTPYQPNQLEATEVYMQEPISIRNAAAFGQLNWQFTNTLQLQVGFRENWDANFNSNFTGVAPPAGSIVSSPTGTGIYAINYPASCSATGGACVPSSYTVRSQSTSDFPGNHEFDSAPTGKIDLNWVPAPGQNFYAFYARGYKSGGTNYGSTEYPSYSSEELNDWELGWKGQLFDDHLRTQVGAYYYDVEHLQADVEDLEYQNDASIGSVNGNIQGDSTLYGLEIAEQARVGGLGVNVNLAYEHTKLGTFNTLNFNALPPGWGSPTPIPQCLAGKKYTGDCFNYTPYEVNVGGAQLPFAPTLTGNISADYNFRVGQGVIDPRVTYEYTSEQYTTLFDEAPYLQLGVRDIWNASVDWIVGKWDTQLYATNFTNDLYVVSDGATVYYGNPRQYGIQSTFRF